MQYLCHVGRQIGEQSVEAPVLGTVSDQDRPNWDRGQDGLPGDRGPRPFDELGRLSRTNDVVGL